MPRYGLSGLCFVWRDHDPTHEETARQRTLPEQKESNRQISRLRIRVEHAIAGVKRYRIVKDQVRARKDNFQDRVMETCCGLHNFRLNFRPWHYKADFVKV